jgi:type VI secretion system secreted protein Hcp
MANDVFLNLGDKIKGDTKDKAQSKAGDIDVKSWDWGMSQSLNLHTGETGGGNVTIDNLTVTKWVDVATPKIMMACCKGTRIPKAVMLVRKPGDDAQKYIEITMEPAIIKRISNSGSGGGGGDDRLSETITLNFSTVKFEFFKQDAKGATSSAGELSWDIAGKATK